MPRISTGRVLRRTFEVPGVEGDVAVEISVNGMVFKAKGTKQGVSATWPEIVNVCNTPGNIPKKFENKPYEFLIYQAKERNRRKRMRLEQRIALELETLRGKTQAVQIRAHTANAEL